MQHSVEAVAQRIANRVAIEQVDCDELRLGRDRLTVPLLEVVEHDHIVAGFQQLLGDN